MGFVRIGFLEDGGVKGTSSYQVNILETIDLWPDVSVPIDCVVCEDDDLSFVSSKVLASQWQNQVLDTLDKSTDYDVTLDVLL